MVPDPAVPPPGTDELARILSILMAVQLSRTHNMPERQQNAEEQAQRAIALCRHMAADAANIADADERKYNVKRWSWRASNLEYLLARAKGLTAEPPFVDTDGQ